MKIIKDKPRVKFKEKDNTKISISPIEFIEKHKQKGSYVVCDFICPTPKARELFNADFIIWVDTIKAGRFDDTNAMFVKPVKFDFHVTTQDAKTWAIQIAKKIKTSPRYVGNVCGQNKHLLIVPCHRVVRSDGSLGGFSMPGGVKTKKKMLKKEGFSI